MVLRNEYMHVEIAAMGAELMHIRDLSADAELLWNGNPAYWKRRSPVLFPNVGKTFGNIMKIGGKTYPTSQHGFARDREFVCEHADETQAVYLLKSDAESLERYPFDFELRISYALKGKKLEVKWSVTNTNEAEMPFTIGGHPAFCFEAGKTKEDYMLEFPGKDALCYVLLDMSSGTALPDRKNQLLLESGRLHLRDELFAFDAMIFDDAQIEEVWLCESDGKRRVGMECPGFPNYGIWSVQDAPFVCLEPWAGRCDNHGFADELCNKPNVNLLISGCVFEKSYNIVLP